MFSISQLWALRSLAVVLALPLAANDIVYLNGQVRLQDHTPPAKAVEIQLSCPGLPPVRQTMTDKKGRYYLKVERDEFNHVARSLPSVSMDIRDAPLAGNCRLIAAAPDYRSSVIDLAGFVIEKDLKLPDLVLTPQTPPAAPHPGDRK